MNTKAIGQAAEKAACHYLEKKGLQLLFRNFSCTVGEIDLIMRDNEDIVFVEVRSRRHSHFGTAVESVDFRKQKKIVNTANYFLQQQKKFSNFNCRFDVIGLTLATDPIKFDWIKNAFFLE